MERFAYARPVSLAEVAKLLSASARPKGGGVDLLDLAKRGVATPETMVDLARVAGQEPPMDGIWVGDHGETTVGARVTLARIAASKEIADHCPLLADAAREAATPQIRNVATLGGNVLQRPRCAYFRDPFFDCRKRGGSTCPALEGVHDEMAIFGNALCCATHPSNLATALVAARAELRVVRGVDEKGAPAWRAAAADEGFFVEPEQDPLREAKVAPGELLWDVIVPHAPASAYVEVNQKASYDWASVACAVVLDVFDGKIREAQVALGAVAPVPFRSKAAEQALAGKAAADEAAWAAAGAAAAEGATPLARNGHKVRQLRAVVRRAVQLAVSRAK